MKYRRFGKTGLQVSALGFGCMRLPVIGGDHSRIDEEKATEMIHHAIDRGVNYIDTAYPYHAESFSKAGSSELFLAKALRNGYREKVLLATKLPAWLVQSREDMDRFLDEQLERLDTATIDFYLLHSMNRTTWDKLVSFGVYDFLDRALAQGKIRYAGFSFHDEIGLFKEIVDAYDWTFCQIMYNYYDVDFQAGREGLHYATAKGLAVVVMEPLRGGALIAGLPDEARGVFKKAAPGRSEANWALGWLWNQPEVSVVLSGMSTLEQVIENLELAGNISDTPWTGEDESAIETVSGIIRKLQRVDCTACGYCLPCPEGVNIPRNFSFCNDHHMLKDPSAKVRYHGFLSEKERASNCVQCGQCEALCPQQIPIMKELEHVVEIFES
jgi:predicted aldo/keto reductase-like oxidoreductase